ncbi:MAG: hypothetical protein MUD08_00575 [Cytophagales bacterium]|jgi:hypothetical protein|nr:hypothetical protein [Cytophagales bacterium]
MSLTDFYVSPFRLLDVSSLASDGGLTDKKDLSKTKKKLLAEIELSDTQTVRVGSNQFSKNDILQFFDTIEDIDNLTYHQAIYQDKALLDFLENGNLDPKSHFSNSTLYQDADFGRFLSPYFAKSLGFLFQKSVRRKTVHATDYLVCKNLFENAEKMHSDTLEQAYVDVTQHLAKRITKLRAIHQDTKEKASVGDCKQEVLDACSFYLICTLNALPNYFLSLRDDYGRALLNIAAETWNKGIDKPLGRSVTHSLADLDCSPDVKEVILKNNNVMGRTVAEKVAKETSGGLSTGRVVVIFIILIKLLLFLISFVSKT